jgi:hypothetical protein
LSCIPLSKISCAKNNSMGYVKKKEKKKYMPKGMREKNTCQRA